MSNTKHHYTDIHFPKWSLLRPKTTTKIFARQHSNQSKIELTNWGRYPLTQISFTSLYQELEYWRALPGHNVWIETIIHEEQELNRRWLYLILTLSVIVLPTLGATLIP